MVVKKNLIVYGSITQNTEKVAFEIDKAFSRHGWQSDLKKIHQGYNVLNPDFDFNDYDFVCVGSPVIWRLPLEAVVRLMRLRDRAHKRIDAGPKKSMVFCTYAGIHLGPKEAEAALKLLEIEIEHLGFRVAHSLAIPGRYGDHYTPQWFHGDMRDRPNQQDLQDVHSCIDAILQSSPIDIQME